MNNELRELDYEPKGSAKFVDGAVNYSLVPDWQNKCENAADATLSWDESRGHWVADVYGDFLEGYEYGRALYLDFSTGPYKLNKSACKMLLRAFNIPEASLSLDDVVKTSPNDLAKLAGDENGA